MNETPEKKVPDSEADLERFAAQLSGAIPVMAPESLVCVKVQVDAELDRLQWRQGRRRWLLGCAVAASIVMAIVAYATSRSERDEVQPDAPPTQTKVRDRVKIVQSDSIRTADAGRPVIVLEDYHSLFSE